MSYELKATGNCLVCHCTWVGIMLSLNRVPQLVKRECDVCGVRQNVKYEV